MVATCAPVSESYPLRTSWDASLNLYLSIVFLPVGGMCPFVSVFCCGPQWITVRSRCQGVFDNFLRAMLRIARRLLPCQGADGKIFLDTYSDLPKLIGIVPGVMGPGPGSDRSAAV